MERKQETIYCLCYFTIIVTLFHFMHQLALLYITFLIKKLRVRSRGPPDGGRPHVMAQWVIRPWIEWCQTFHMQCRTNAATYVRGRQCAAGRGASKGHPAYTQKPGQTYLGMRPTRRAAVRRTLSRHLS